jgi:hypothetical protein
VEGCHCDGSNLIFQSGGSDKQEVAWRAIPV